MIEVFNLPNQIYKQSNKENRVASRILKIRIFIKDCEFYFSERLRNLYIWRIRVLLMKDCEMFQTERIRNLSMKERLVLYIWKIWQSFVEKECPMIHDSMGHELWLFPCLYPYLYPEVFKRLPTTQILWYFRVCLRYSMHEPHTMDKYHSNLFFEHQSPISELNSFSQSDGLLIPETSEFKYACIYNLRKSTMSASNH